MILLFLLSLLPLLRGSDVVQCPSDKACLYFTLCGSNDPGTIEKVEFLNSIRVNAFTPYRCADGTVNKTFQMQFRPTSARDLSIHIESPMMTLKYVEFAMNNVSFKFQHIGDVVAMKKGGEAIDSKLSVTSAADAPMVAQLTFTLDEPSYEVFADLKVTSREGKMWQLPGFGERLKAIVSPEPEKSSGLVVGAICGAIGAVLLVGGLMDDLEGVLDDADSHELLSVVASAHHQRASKMLDLVPLSEELDLGKIALELKGVSNVHGLVNSINCPFVGLIAATCFYLKRHKPKVIKGHSINGTSSRETFVAYFQGNTRIRALLLSDRPPLNNIMGLAIECVEKHMIWRFVRSALERAIGSNEVEQIFLLSSGSFSSLQLNGPVQLALTLILGKYYPSASIYFQDPVVNDHEKDWLKDYDVIVREETTLSNFPEMVATQSVRIVLCIRTLYEILEEYLEYDWQNIESGRTIMICNAIRHDTEEEMRQFEEEANMEFEYIRKFERLARSRCLPNIKKHTHAFRKSAIIRNLPVIEKLSWKREGELSWRLLITIPMRYRSYFGLESWSELDSDTIDSEDIAVYSKLFKRSYACNYIGSGSSKFSSASAPDLSTFLPDAALTVPTITLTISDFKLCFSRDTHARDLSINIESPMTTLRYVEFAMNNVSFKFQHIGDVVAMTEGGKAIDSKLSVTSAADAPMIAQLTFTLAEPSYEAFADLKIAGTCFYLKRHKPKVIKGHSIKGTSPSSKAREVDLGVVRSQRMPVPIGNHSWVEQAGESNKAVADLPDPSVEGFGPSAEIARGEPKSKTGASNERLSKEPTVASKEKMSRENASAENVGHIKDSAEPMKQSAEKVRRSALDPIMKSPEASLNALSADEMIHRLKNAEVVRQDHLSFLSTASVMHSTTYSGSRMGRT
ncbi:hypothetical protein PRIPAC_85445, partial [Pristionchus pacificus]|uniref:SRR1 domain-containing protein n=1 Tax=Pristionchus pacificus TaxID=54126 RepID=A0A2A6BL80_PRIPA